MNGKIVGNWWNNKDIELLQMEDGKIYALNDWNGECWLNCWECLGEYNMNSSDDEYIITPIYKGENIVGYDIV